MMVMIFWIVIWVLILNRSAHAYLDPGTGSMIIQLVIGSVAALFFTIKLYWQKIKQFLRIRPPTPSDEDPQG